MKIVDLIRLLLRNLFFLVTIPLILAGLVFYMTRNPVYTYSSETTLYTGIASGSSVEMDKSLSFFATNTAFDNLINIIKSRDTQQETAIRLFAMHLMLPKSDPRYISDESYISLKRITPQYISALVANTGNQNSSFSKKKNIPTKNDTIQSKKVQTVKYLDHIVKANETLFSISRQYGITVDQVCKLNGITGNKIKTGQKLRVEQQMVEELAHTEEIADTLNDAAIEFSFSSLDTSLNSFPSTIDREAYEQTVKNLEAYMSKNDTNFVYKLLYFNHPHYSIKAISGVNVQRVQSSDLVRLKYNSNDPGVCQQTLALLTEVCIKNYKAIKENRSDAVVKYFEHQLRQASVRLKVGEDKLLQFNEEKNIINYYEQSKAVAVVKEELDVEYNNMRIKLAGNLAAIKRIEEKLGVQKQIQLKSSSIIELRNKLSEINSRIVTSETIGYENKIDNNQLSILKAEGEKLKEKISLAVGEVYSFGNSTEGLPVNKLLTDWISNVLEYEDLKAGIAVLAERIKEFQKQYAIYAPAGANIKRIEREINVSEQEFLEILHGLNLAKLKMQDAELSSTIKAVDPPFFPLSPNPTKRKVLIVAAAMVGFILMLSLILALEYFDDTLKNPEKLSKIIGINVIGIFPKIFLKKGTLNFSFVANRLLEIINQKLYLLTLSKENKEQPRTLLFISSLSNEGKTVTAGNIAFKLKKQGKKVLFLNFSRESLRINEINQIGYSKEPPLVSTSGVVRRNNAFNFISRILGYGDQRIDSNSPFLKKPHEYLEEDEYFEYQIDHEYFNSSSYQDLMKYSSGDYSHFDYVLIEIPPILYYSFPTELITSADLAVLVCRSNRSWTEADSGVYETLKNQTKCEPVAILNGVELIVVETVLGELPKKRGFFRKLFKRIVTLEVFSKHQL